MPRVFAVAAQLPSLTRAEAVETFSLALREWLGDRWPKTSGWFDHNLPGGLSTPAGRFRWEPYETAGLLLVDFVWTHFDARAAGVLWTTTATLHTLSYAGLQLEIDVSNDGPDVDEPGALLTSRSRLPLVLSELTAVRVGSTAISATARRISAEAVADFVRYELLDSTRTLPITVVSPTESGSFLVAPDSVAGGFAATSEVVALDTPEAAWELTRSLGDKRLSCFHGALRTYMPGLRGDSDPFAHPLLTAARVALPAARHRLAQTLAIHAAQRYMSPAGLATIRTERAIEYANRTAALLASRELGSSAKSNEAVEAALAQLAERESQLVGENASLRRENERLLLQTRRLRDDLRRIRSDRSTESAGEPVFAPESVLEAVENADYAYRGSLVLLPSAFAAAEESPYRKPVDVQRLLFAMGDIALSTHDGALGRDLYSVLREHGFTYRADAGETTSSKLLGQYMASFQGDEYACTEHVRLGTTYDPEDCLVVYFASDLKNARFIIKSVGRHFQNMTST